MKKSAALLASAILASVSSPLAFSDITVGPGDVHTVPGLGEIENNVTVNGGTIDGPGVLTVLDHFSATSGTVSNAELGIYGTMEKNSGGTLFLPERLLIVGSRGQINDGKIEATNLTLLDVELYVGSSAAAVFTLDSSISLPSFVDIILDGDLDYYGASGMSVPGVLALEGGSGYAYLADFSSFSHGLEIISSNPGAFTGTIHLDNSRAGRNYGSTSGVFENADVILTNNSFLYVRSENVGSLSGDDSSVFRIRGRVEVGGNGTNTVFNGYIDRTGPYAALVKTGTGTMVFGGTTDWLSDTFIEEGSFLMKDGSEIRSDVFVAGGAYFGGEGYVRGDLFSSGTVLAGMPGHAGTLYIRDDFGQGDNGRFIVQFDSYKDNSRMVVRDNVFLDGGTIKFIASKPSHVPRNTNLSVIETEYGEVYGAFDKAKAFGRLIPHLIYDEYDVLVNFSARKFTSFPCLTPNGKEVARQLDRMDKQSSGSGRKLIDKIDDLTWGKEGVVCNLINHYLSPEQMTSIFRAGFAAGQIQAGNIERHLEFAREDAGYLYEGRALNLSGKYGSIETNGGPINHGDGLTLAGFDSKTVVKKEIAPPVLVPAKWNFFVTGTGEWGDIENTRDSLGTDLTTGGVTVGADYRVCDNFLVGLTGGYNHTTSDLWDDGRIRVNGGRGGAYASLFNENAYLNLLATGGYNSYDTRRSTLGGHARGKSHGGEFNGLIGGGYEFDCAGWRVGPIGGLQYTYIQLDSFDEHDSDARLHYPKQSQNSLRSTLGARVAYDWEFCGVRVTPEVRAQWLHEYLDSTASIDSRFAAGGAVFTVDGAKIGRNGLLVDAGVSVQVTSHCALYAYYTGDLARDNYTAHAVNGGLRVQF